jgi:lipoprotein NlpD
MKQTKLFLVLSVSAAVLAACSMRPPSPIVVERPTQTRPSPPLPDPVMVAPPVAVPVPVAPSSAAGSDQFPARRGDTWVSLGRQFNLPPKDLAAWNNASPDSPIREGQLIRIQAPSAAIVPPPLVATPIPVAPTTPITPAAPAGDVKREPKASKVPYSDEAYSRLTKGATPAATTRAAGPMPTSPMPSAQAAVTAPSGTPGAGFIPGQSPVLTTAPITTTATTAAPVIAAGPTSETDSIAWQWPVAGKVSKKFSETAMMKGIAVDGKGGTPIYAAAAGRVVYAGEGLRNYGKLVIVRHNEQYTSVYGHNSVINVKEGDSVKRGQKIAEMGNTETDATRLFFEIRRSGKQVDPEKFLPNR